MEKINVVTLIIQLLILFIGLYLAFLKSYFTEKGKQLAVKEDIEEITIQLKKLNQISRGKMMK